MTTHAMTLPGHPDIHDPRSTDCRGTDCHLVVGPAIAGDTASAWHAALEGGAEAMDTYLKTYNSQFKGKHEEHCEFSDLPPSIHVACHGSYEALVEELNSANDALNE
ncbi:hypothetical protein [Streptomyces liliifuscus]|uniref:Uncharacterized protein n=1 Tax=Streptomyces liliifuscus TaxID=2797636 RepID=A0A7T7KWK9_9ACTN|nr:hypothetical protein [Streptomyces liliifuscus]QQM41241.1 hypothetical protein JEQ17_18365 [Streptomyces liliifuscus]